MNWLARTKSKYEAAQIGSGKFLGHCYRQFAARAHGLLGRMVWAVQNDRARARQTRRRASGQSRHRQVNIDEAPELAARFGITSIPTLIVFKGGQAEKTLRGAQSEAVLAAALSAASN